MNKKDILKLLRSADEDSAVWLSEEYHGISENDDRRLWRKVQEKLNGEENYQTEEFHIICDEVTVKNSRLSWLSKAVTAAAYAFIAGLVITGIFHINDFENEIDKTDLPLSVADEVSIPWNMLSSGIMTVDVKNAEFTAEGIYEITIELKSKNALSVTGTTTFMADNFMVAYLGENGIEKSVMPCEISEAGEVYPYAFTLTDGEKRELTLSYGIDSVPDVLISGYSDNTLYLKLRED
ncbi:MAG: hypothetical protein IKV85_06315 [Ruminococcus sp.]|nr:hypothetical protein [Ruminococcus sp.]